MADLKTREIRDSYQDLLTKGSGNTVEDGDGVPFDIFDRAFTAGGLVRLPSGLNFNASGGSTLNRYADTQTFTPTLKPFTTDFDSITYSQRLGWYTVIGHRCLFEVRIATSSVTVGAGSGSIVVEDFPFLPLGDAAYRVAVSLAIIQGFTNKPDNASMFGNFNGVTLYRGISTLQPSDISSGINNFIMSGHFLIQP